MGLKEIPYLFLYGFKLNENFVGELPVSQSGL